MGNQKIESKQQGKIAKKVEWLVANVLNVNPDLANKYNLTAYEGAALASIKYQLEHGYRLSINQASFIADLCRRMRKAVLSELVPSMRLH